MSKNGMAFSTHAALMITVAFTSVCWIIAAYVAPQTDHDVLASFYLKVRPSGPGWTVVRERAGISATDAADNAMQDNIPRALLGWAVGCATIWSSLFAVGSFLYGRTTQALVLTAIFIVCGSVLISIVKTLWAGDPHSTETA